jgi:alpha-mannosidase
MNGCDHQPVQADLSAALQTARALFPEVAFIHTDFPHYIDQVKAALPEQLATVRGELRSQRTDGWWTLVNTASARVYLKQANHRSQTQLEKVAEPLAAWAALLGHAYPRHLFTYAWKMLMQNHPHDSICGCSVDEVHREMLTRFTKSEQVAAAIAQSSLDAIVAQVDTAAPWAASDPGALPFAVFNTSGWERSGAASVEIDVRRLPLGASRAETAETIAQLQALPLDGYAVIDSAGRPVAATLEDVGVRFGYELPHDRFRQPYMARAVRVTLSASAVPALGYRSYALVRRPAGLAPAAPAAAPGSAATLENEFLSVQIAENGTLRLTDKRTGRVYDGLCAYEDVGDIGNEYVFRQPDGDQALSTTSQVARVTLQEHSTVRTVYEIVHQWMIPASADQTLDREQREFMPLLERTARRSASLISQTITTRVTLDHGVPYLTVQTTLDNQAKDHRLRVLLPTDCAAPTYQVDSIFEVATRETVPASEWHNPSNCQHQQAFVHVGDATGGLTIANHGLPEYEVLRDDRGTIALTLLRAVGELGDWGVFPTPEAQCLGQHAFSYAIIPHAADHAPIEAYQHAYQFQVPWMARQVPLHTGELPADHSFLRWSGEGMALTTVKIAEESDDLILRWFNTGAQRTTLRVGFAAGIGDWYRSTILEDDAGSVGTDATLSVRGAEIVTLGGRRSTAG